ncbi:short-chain dehydrogenase [Leptospira ellinghausenii]|uniref:Short-chain dehydrogenase n=1 Tax=Leptospira ellinghausenii TaxID=1917822 RepID=A0A2P2DC78_9LEPT|nr:SDR family oxidoreductase [Leptospira ellinghausenii]GBF42232.1 short-chain dehydrogenase [Leptospira ellinghausenii]
MKLCIIGASSGIGKAIASLCIKEGHEVYGTYFQHSETDMSFAGYRKLNVLEEKLDLDFLPETLDGLVYCPGSVVLKPFVKVSADEFISDYQLQVIGMTKVIQAVLPRLKTSTQASIVVFSTVAVQSGFPFHSIVSASKGAIEGLTKALAAEFSPNIRVNCIAPSITETPLVGNLLNTIEKKEMSAKRHPLKKIGKPEDIANLVKFLLTEESSWMTGQVLPLDGGISTLRVSS